MPKLKDAERTKNPKGGAINFPVACLAPGPYPRCLHQGVGPRIVAASASPAQWWEASFRTPKQAHVALRRTGETARRPKDSQSEGHFGGSQRLRNALTSSLGRRRVKSSSYLSRCRLRSATRQGLRFFEGREVASTAASSGRIVRASARSMSQRGSASAGSPTSARPVIIGQNVFAPRRRELRNDKESRWLAAAVTL